MLESLDKIDWSKLTHAYGEASDVPDLLRQLASPDSDARAEALDELCGNIWHQGTVYEATAFAAPFLLELIESPEVEGKDEILILLAHLARGTSYHDVHQHLPMLKGQAQSPEWHEKIQKELVWVRNVKDAVYAGEKAYCRLLDDPDPALRDAAAYVLAAFQSSTPRLAGAVLERFKEEADERVQASLLLAFGSLAEPTESNRNSLLATLTGPHLKSLRLAAAMALARLDPARVPDDALATLVEATQSPNDYESVAESVWGRMDDVQLLIIKHLSCLDAGRAASAVDMFAKVLSTREHPAALAITEVLLHMAFRDSNPRAAFASLNEQQQRVVGLIAQNRNIWMEQVGREEKLSVRTPLLLRSCGLPDALPKLRGFIDSTNIGRGDVPVDGQKSGIGAALKKFFGRSPRS